VKKPGLSLVLTLALFCTIGCSINGRFYPIKGPLAAQAPQPVFAGKFTARPPYLDVTATLNNGEKATGSLLRVYPVPKGVTLPPPAPMQDQWDEIFGKGNYVATVLGQGQDAQGVLTGSGGTILNVEIHANGMGGGTTLVGVAQDNKGNLYKIAFF
jgi:hypothetical protein